MVAATANHLYSPGATTTSTPRINTAAPVLPISPQIFLGSIWLIIFQNDNLDTWFVMQAPIEFGSLKIVFIKSIDTILKVITLVLFIASFQWYF